VIAEKQMRSNVGAGGDRHPGGPAGDASPPASLPHGDTFTDTLLDSVDHFNRSDGGSFLPFSGEETVEAE
jgi:hypothetical protein